MTNCFDLEPVVIGGISTEDALSGASPAGRCFARLTISTAHDALLAFVNAELDRGVEDADILTALGRWMVQIHASVAAHSLQPEGAEMMAGVLKQQIDLIYADHMRQASAWLASHSAEPRT